MSKDDCEPPEQRLLRLLSENPVDLHVVEALRLVVAFNKISDPADRRMIIDLAERLASG
ncbi:MULTISPECIES: hypothetical protein [unclassified Bradyrhizobium]|uniref:hypothetical protein n=1 Tax=Bradyrhizobium TaxID=374 RepID=UPI0028E593C9|nr:MULTISPECIES: hypothetical protein [unclassified Bradyrhizobium]